MPHRGESQRRRPRISKGPSFKTSPMGTSRAPPLSRQFLGCLRRRPRCVCRSADFRNRCASGCSYLPPMCADFKLRRFRSFRDSIRLSHRLPCAAADPNLDPCSCFYQQTCPPGSHFPCYSSRFPALLCVSPVPSAPCLPPRSLRWPQPSPNRPPPPMASTPMSMATSTRSRCSPTANSSWPASSRRLAALRAAIWPGSTSTARLTPPSIPVPTAPSGRS